MLEWDAAAFNDYVREHERAMAQIKSALSNLKGSKSTDAASERARLRNLAAESERSFVKRAKQFWFGEEGGG
jgi:hypothetical protein